MQYKNTIEAVYIHLDEIQQLVAKLGVDGAVRAIDVDLTLDKIRNVYDLLIHLRNESTEPVFEVPEEESKEAKVPGVGTDEEMPEEEDNPIELSVEPTEVPEGAEVVEESERPEPAIEKKEATQAEIHSRVKPVNERRNIGESFAKDKPSLHEELTQSTPKEDLSSKLKTKPISSLSSAIGLNEKFELIQNLFDGDTNKYNHTLDVLNMATDFNEAYEYLSTNFNWEMNEPLVQRILELIRRKLIVKKNE